MKSFSKLLLSSALVATMANATPYKLDSSHTEVGFSVKHLMITNVKGKFKTFDADIDFNHRNKTFKKFNAVVQTNSVDTGIEKRDNHLRSEDFFLSEKYPQITFNMKLYKKDDDDDEGDMIGDLTIRGITKKIKLEVEDLGTIKDFEGNNRVGFTLKGEVNRKDYGLKWNKALEAGGFAVGDKVKIIIEVEAVEK